MHPTDSVPATAPTAPAPPLSDFLLGDWLVQPDLNRLSRHGNAMQVRPQLMDVLVCLASAPNRTVHRDELLRRVWPGQSTVADTAIARCIAELRHALGDQAAAPTHIETIHKRGYRVIAQVAAAADPPVAAPAAPATRRPVAPLAVPVVRLAWMNRARLLLRHVAAAFALR
jgi:DNA-binding winged helix-turn-helix (wHTH) protein